MRYIGDILDTHVRFYAVAIGDLFLLMGVNIRPHTALTVVTEKGN